MKTCALFLLSAFLLAKSVTALYSRADDVIELTSANFQKKVGKSDSVWMVEFYAPWCGHCKNLAPAWKEAASQLKGVVNVAAVDATQAEDLAGKYGIKGFPTIKVFAGSSKGKEYSGGRDASSIVAAGLKEATALVRSRSGSKSGGKSKKQSKSGGAGSNRKRAGEPGGGKHVVTLTDDNFDQLVMGSDEPWMVEFYAPWCGHCKSLAPEWSSAAEELDGDVRLGAVDATVHQQLAQRFAVQGYPTIKTFPAGMKGGDEVAADYQGAREAAAIVSFAQSQLASAAAVAPVTQLTSQEVWNDVCSKKRGKKLCVVVFLRSLLDETAADRSAYLDMLEGVAKNKANSLYRFVWAEIGTQPQLERALNVQPESAPAAVAVSVSKGRAAQHAGSFDAQGLQKFLSGVTSGRVVPAKLRGDKSFTVQQVDAWDGSDVQVAREEEFSLDDILNEDL